MKNYADLEVTLRPGDSSRYAVNLRCTLAGLDVDVSHTGSAQFDFDQLRGLSVDPLDYAKLLTDSLFRNPTVLAAFSEARSAAQAVGTNMQIRLEVDPAAPELHSLHWEALLDPRDGSYLFAGEDVLFSRYLSSLDWQPARLRPKDQLTGLAVVANPANLAQYRMQQVDVDGEIARVRRGMSGIGLTTIASGGGATLTNLSDTLRDGGHDILYLVCHGSIVDGVPWLWLEDNTGNVERVRGIDFVSRLKELQRRPRLVVLASCQTAGSGDVGRAEADGALVAVGPRLAGVGIPAVIAMQGGVSMETVARFMPVFFRELLLDGQIDRATAIARGAVRDRPDFWMPVLFMRSRSGRIWEEADKGEAQVRAAVAGGVVGGGTSSLEAAEPGVQNTGRKAFPSSSAAPAPIPAPPVVAARVTLQPRKSKRPMRILLPLLVLIGVAGVAWFSKKLLKPDVTMAVPQSAPQNVTAASQSAAVAPQPTPVPQTTAAQLVIEKSSCTTILPGRYRIDVSGFASVPDLQTHYNIQWLRLTPRQMVRSTCSSWSGPSDGDAFRVLCIHRSSDPPKTNWSAEWIADIAEPPNKADFILWEVPVGSVATNSTNFICHPAPPSAAISGPQVPADGVMLPKHHKMNAPVAAQLTQVIPADGVRWKLRTSPREMEGEVKDQRGNPVVALIVLNRTDTFDHYQVRCRNDGTWLYTGLPYGTYKVDITINGQTVASKDGVVIGDRLIVY